MTDNVIVTHTKHDNIADKTQADVDRWIAEGNLPAGTLLADLVLPSDWNANHTIAGMTQLLSSIRDYVIVDMGGADYTMTDAEAVSFLKIIANEGVGSTLTWPSSSDAYYSIDQAISTQYTTHPITIACQSGGETAVLPAGLKGSCSLGVIPGLVIYSKTQQESAYMRQGTNGVNVQSADYTATADDSGKLIVFDDTVLHYLTISPASITDYGTNAVIYLTCENTEKCAVFPDTGVTISGNSFVYRGAMLTLQRDGDTDNWYSTSTEMSFIAAQNKSNDGTYYPLFRSANYGIVYKNTSNYIFTIASGVGTLTTNIVKVDDDAYGAGWNASLAVPTKNAIYDKIESGLTLGKSIGISSQYLALN